VNPKLFVDAAPLVVVLPNGSYECRFAVGVPLASSCTGFSPS
jgi:hypothetical protein